MPRFHDPYIAMKASPRYSSGNASAVQNAIAIGAPCAWYSSVLATVEEQ
jgi:hypothetical protein